MEIGVECRYLKVRRSLIDRFFERMNPAQKNALFAMDGPVLILAGAGSGKTTVVINRIANMIRFGDAYISARVPECVTEETVGFLEACNSSSEPVPEEAIKFLKGRTVAPRNILAITFTNKAAGELKERLATMLGKEGTGVTAATFHSVCVKILRNEIQHMGHKQDFTIYDAADSIRLMKSILIEMELDIKKFEPKTILGAVSRAKDALIEPTGFEEWYTKQGEHPFIAKKYAEAYRLYQEQLSLSNALDFDDLIMKTDLLFIKHRNILARYQEKYRYILVDEYQDTNLAQFELVRLLSGKYHNLCVVGDDDQSIYKFRGATIKNILEFEKCFPGAQVFRLEQNYRSTSTILDAANSIIVNNVHRKGKMLWTKNEIGQKIHVYQASDERDEARYVCDEISRKVNQGEKLSQFVVLYRTNAQSQVLERAMVENSIPYHVVGGLRFYDRKEIKDLLAYLTLLIHPHDNLRFRRIINTPRRGIGSKTMDALVSIAQQEKCSLLEAASHSHFHSEIGRKAEPLIGFATLIKRYASQVGNLSISDLIWSLAKDSGYIQMLHAKGAEGETALENIAELRSAAARYEKDTERATLESFLEDVTLFSELDKTDEEADFVTLMTIHASKGLEFDTVFLTGMEDGLFPHAYSIFNEEDLSEERRMAYVAVTRAEKTLHISYAEERLRNGETRTCEASRFLDEIPRNLKELKLNPAAKGKGTVSPVERFAMKQSEAAKLRPGMRVSHKDFGAGWVISTRNESDHIQSVVVMFDQGQGQKRIVASCLMKI